MAVTIGNFDGVHLGHQALLKQLLLAARKIGGISVVVTFDPHPQTLFRTDPMNLLFDQNDQADQMRKLGIDILVIEPFTRAFSELSPNDFFHSWFLAHFNPKFIVVGSDFGFGFRKSGTIDLLSHLANSRGINVEVVLPILINGTRVSSNEIRRYLLEGKVGPAREFLGRPFYLRGLVVRGDGRGTQLGIPTANISRTTPFLPKAGVYATWTQIDGVFYESVTNIGRAPTFINNPIQDSRIETHILNFSGDLYGQSITLHFGEFLREEQKFSSSEELVHQIRNDICSAEQFLKKIEKPCRD